MVGQGIWFGLCSSAIFALGSGKISKRAQVNCVFGCLGVIHKVDYGYAKPTQSLHHAEG